MIISRLLSRYELYLYKEKKQFSLIDIIFYIFLLPFSLLYSIAILVSFSIKRLKQKIKLSIPIISIGNITLGGTGKTPLVIYIYKLLQKEDYKRIAIISRGYKRKSQEDMHILSFKKELKIEKIGDEPFLLKKNLPDSILLIGKRKRKLVREAYNKYNADAIILDDAFRHYDISSYRILTIDGSRGFGNRLIFPAGPNRQFLWTRNKADSFIILKKNNENLKEHLRYFNKPVFNCNYSIKGIFDENGESKPDRKRAVLISGIGNNESFFDTAGLCGFEIIDFIKFIDHKAYNIYDIAYINSRTKDLDFDLYLTTEKDFYKILSIKSSLSKILYYVKVELEFGEHNIDAQIKNYCKRNETTK